MAPAKGGDIRSLQVVLVVYLAVFIMKLAVYLVTGVYALFAEALHTLSDIFITIFLLVAILFSRKAADEDHMYGHGRAQNAAALVAATLFISFTSFKLYEEAIPRLYTHHEAAYSNLWLAVDVLVVSMVIAAIPMVLMFLRKKLHGAAAKAQMMELVNDELGLLAALVGTLFIIEGDPIADPIAALAVATIIALNAVGLFRENFSLLMGGHPGKQYIGDIEHLALSVQGVVSIHELRVEYLGSDSVHVDLHVVVRKGLNVEDADEISEEVCRRVERFTGSKYCVVHLDTASQAEIDALNRKPDRRLRDNT
jgi:cation diffusion facilitator family transporter